MTIAVPTIARIQNADDFGSTPGAGNDLYGVAWDNDNSEFILAAAGGVNMPISKIGSNVMIVDPKGAGAYTTLSAALTAAALLTPATNNEVLIVVAGEVVETTALTALDHVHVLFLAGACVTITSNSTLNAVNMTGMTNAVWAAVDSRRPHIVRAGAVSAGSHGISMNGCDNGVVLNGLYVQNATTGAAFCYGIYNVLTSSPTMNNCTAVGGSGGSGCYGVYNRYASNPTMSGCTSIGGSGGSACYGIRNYASNPTMISCTSIGGSGGSDCYGCRMGDGSKPLVMRSVFYGGGSYPVSTNVTIAASSRTENTFQPTATQPWRLLAVLINVTAAAAAGVTLTLRDATGGGGNALSAATAVSSTGYSTIAITGHRVISASSYVYAALSASDATLAYVVYYIYETCNTACYAIYHDSNAPVVFDDCLFVSNAASSAVYVSNSGDDLSRFLGGIARSGLNDGTRQKAFVCQSSWSPGQVYNMVLDGGSTNLTAAAGTANGSNIEL